MTSHTALLLGSSTLLFATSACSSAPASPPSAPAASAQAARDDTPSARVTDVVGDGAGKGRAKVLFSNTSKKPCRISGYTMRWSGRSKALNVGEFALPPGETRERWIKLDHDDGELTAITPDTATIELRVDCG